MGDVVSLRLHRKRRDRAAKEEQAAENRVRFGRTKAEKERQGKEADLAARRLEGHRRTGDDPAES